MRKSGRSNCCKIFTIESKHSWYSSGIMSEFKLTYGIQKNDYSQNTAISSALVGWKNCKNRIESQKTYHFDGLVCIHLSCWPKKVLKRYFAIKVIKIIYLTIVVTSVATKIPKLVHKSSSTSSINSGSLAIFKIEIIVVITWRNQF